MNQHASSPRLRFAPSPTGYLHVGGARTALLNWLFARKFGGQFLLRIEDTDKARSTDESTQAIFEGLEWLGLDWDEDIVFQGANVERHRADAEQLLTTGLAYRCFCTQEELAARRDEAKAHNRTFVYDRRCDRLDAMEVARRVDAGNPCTIRFRVPEGHTNWPDLVHETISFPNADIEDFIILRTDGTPIYNMAVVSDDIAMRITLVMRGDDHISNTPKQIMLYQALGAALPQFAHLPMIHGPDGKKLSKRHGATAVGDYHHLGILPSAMRNFLALLGWAPGHDIEIMSTEQMIALFDPTGLHKKAAIFDTKKLEWMNGQYIVALPTDDLIALIAPTLISMGVTSEADLASRHDWLVMLFELLKIRARTLDEVARQAAPYFVDAVTFDADAMAKHWKDTPATTELLEGVRAVLAPLTEWTLGSTESALRSHAAQLGLGEKLGKIFQPLRVALTGVAASPGIFEVLVLLGQKRSLARLDAALEQLAKNSLRNSG